jgi:heme exporter protein D
MHWNSLDHFLDMGGYGLYVWGSYGVTAALLIVEGVLLVRRHREARADVRRRALLDGEGVR